MERVTEKSKNLRIKQHVAQVEINQDPHTFSHLLHTKRKDCRRSRKKSWYIHVQDETGPTQGNDHDLDHDLDHYLDHDLDQDLDHDLEFDLDHDLDHNHHREHDHNKTHERGHDNIREHTGTTTRSQEPSTTDTDMCTVQCMTAGHNPEGWYMIKTS